MFIEISYPLGQDTPCYPDDPPFSMEQSTTGGVSLSLYHLGSHLGTHVDFPRHFFPDGKDAAAFPPHVFLGKAKVLFFPRVASIGKAELSLCPIKKGDRILLKTDVLQAHPALTLEGAAYLAEQGVQLVGINQLSIEHEENSDYPVHRLLLSANIPIIETLHLEDVAEGCYRLFCLPLAIQGGDASPVRVLLERCE